MIPPTEKFTRMTKGQSKAITLTPLKFLSVPYTGYLDIDVKNKILFRMHLCVCHKDPESGEIKSTVLTRELIAKYYAVLAKIQKEGNYTFDVQEYLTTITLDNGEVLKLKMECLHCINNKSSLPVAVEDFVLRPYIVGIASKRDKKTGYVVYTIFADFTQLINVVGVLGRPLCFPTQEQEHDL